MVLGGGPGDPRRRVEHRAPGSGRGRAHDRGVGAGAHPSRDRGPAALSFIRMTVVSSEKRPQGEERVEATLVPPEVPEPESDEVGERWRPHVPEFLKGTTWRFWVFT